MAFLISKMYSENSRDPFPQDLAMLCQYIARVVGFNDFSAEAAIVNYYHMDSTLSGHTDNSEQNKEAPLFSFR
jgi:alkylated DNA repair protein alkB family protein 1